MNVDLSNIDFPARININFALEKEAESVVISMNAILLKAGCDEIDFSENSDHIPHVTLLMGEVSSRRALEELIEAYLDFTKNEQNIPYCLGKPYWKKPSQKFLFSDIQPQESFLDFRARLYSHLKELILPDLHGGPDNPSHITIGYGNKGLVSLNDIMSQYKPIASQAISIRVCTAGERGTCNRIIYTTKLK